MVEGSVGIVVLDRPEVRNALDGPTVEYLVSALTEFDASEAIDCIVLTGADPAFCAGLDLQAVASGELDLAGGGPDLCQDFRQIDTPIIGAINGAAVAGGLELALLCDFLIASERATFADTHLKVGVHPSWGLTVHLPRAVGLPMAREMSLTGRYVRADEALRIGLVIRVVPHDMLLQSALEKAVQVSGSAPGIIGELRTTYREVTGLNLECGVAVERRRAARMGYDRASLDGRRMEVLKWGRAQTDSRGVTP